MLAILYKCSPWLLLAFAIRCIRCSSKSKRYGLMVIEFCSALNGLLFLRFCFREHDIIIIYNNYAPYYNNYKYYIIIYIWLCTSTCISLLRAACMHDFMHNICCSTF